MNNSNISERLEKLRQILSLLINEKKNYYEVIVRQEKIYHRSYKNENKIEEKTATTDFSVFLKKETYLKLLNFSKEIEEFKENTIKSFVKSSKTEKDWSKILLGSAFSLDLLNESSSKRYLEDFKKKKKNLLYVSDIGWLFLFVKSELENIFKKINEEIKQRNLLKEENKSILPSTSRTSNIRKNLSLNNLESLKAEKEEEISDVIDERITYLSSLNLIDIKNFFEKIIKFNNLYFSSIYMSSLIKNNEPIKTKLFEEPKNIFEKEKPEEPFSFSYVFCISIKNVVLSEIKKMIIIEILVFQFKNQKLILIKKKEI